LVASRRGGLNASPGLSRLAKSRGRAWPQQGRAAAQARPPPAAPASHSLSLSLYFSPLLCFLSAVRTRGRGRGRHGPRRRRFLRFNAVSNANFAARVRLVARGRGISVTRARVALGGGCRARWAERCQGSLPPARLGRCEYIWGRVEGARADWQTSSKDWVRLARIGQKDWGEGVGKLKKGRQNIVKDRVAILQVRGNAAVPPACPRRAGVTAQKPRVQRGAAAAAQPGAARTAGAAARGGARRAALQAGRQGRGEAHCGPAAWAAPSKLGATQQTKPLAGGAATREPPRVAPSRSTAPRRAARHPPTALLGRLWTAPPQGTRATRRPVTPSPSVTQRRPASPRITQRRPASPGVTAAPLRRHLTPLKSLSL
jgi:hypothetical protein